MNSADLAIHLLRLRDQVKFGLIVHQSVNDVLGYSVDLSENFERRVDRAVDELDVIIGGVSRPSTRADARRRRAILGTYRHGKSGGFGASMILDMFTEAMADYRWLDPTGDAAISDHFGVAIASIEQMLTLRSLGVRTVRDPLVDLSPAHLGEIGLAHLPVIAHAERLATYVLDGDRHRPPPPALDVEVSRSRFPRETAEYLLVLAADRLSTDEPVLALPALADAISLAADLVAPAFDTTALHLERACAHHAMAMVHPDSEEALRWHDSAGVLVEQVRGGWMLGRSVSDPLWEPLDRILLEGIRHAAQSDAPNSGRVGLRLVEAQRRRQLAGLLRSARFVTKAASADVLGARYPVRDQLDLVSAAESRQISASGSGFAAGLPPIRASRFDASGAFVQQPRQDVADVALDDLSDFFCDAFEPEPVDVDNVIERLAGLNALIYLLDTRNIDGTTLVRVWVRPTGEVSIDGVRPQRVLSEWHVDRWIHTPSVKRSILGQLICDDVLPREFQHTMALEGERAKVAIIPDGPLASLPWAALPIPNGQFLVQRADLYYCPSASLLERQGNPEAWLPSAAGLVRYNDDRRIDFRALDVYLRQIVPVDATLADLLSTLVDRPRAELSSVLVVAHGIKGSESGLDQGLIDAGTHTQITAVDLLDVPWPPNVFLIACDSSAVQWRVDAGYAPFGLAVACLAGGAQTVIGGFQPLPADLTIRFLTEDSEDFAGFLPRLTAADEHPFVTLSRCQSAWISRYETGGLDWRDTAPIDWASLGGLSLTIPER